MAVILITALVTAAAICLGYGAHVVTKKDDSPVEQIAEAFLKTKGIDIDFSADDKVEENKEANES